MPTRQAAKSTPPPATKKKRGTNTSIAQEPAPRLPHEQDESSDQQAGPLDANVVQAAKDLKRGLVDTDRGAVMHETYKKQKTGGS